MRVLGHGSIDARVGSDDWRFRAFPTAFDWDSTKPFDPDDEFALLGNGLWFSGAITHDVRVEIEREPVDVLIADCMLFGALTAGEATVALFHTAYASFRGGPLVEMLSWGIPLINASREECSLRPVASFAELHDGCALALIATPREFGDSELRANAREAASTLARYGGAADAAREIEQLVASSRAARVEAPN